MTAECREMLTNVRKRRFGWVEIGFGMAGASGEIVAAHNTEILREAQDEGLWLG